MPPALALPLIDASIAYVGADYRAAMIQVSLLAAAAGRLKSGEETAGRTDVLSVLIATTAS
jgi:hypothetical protein